MTRLLNVTSKFVASWFLRSLTLLVLKATDLNSKERENKTHPFCKVKVVDTGRARLRGEKRTTVKKATINPEWNETLVLYVFFE